MATKMLAMAVQVDQLRIAVNQADDDDADADTESQVPTWLLNP